MTTRLDNALERLNELLADGWEYPDAEYRAARDIGVTCDALRAEYDAAETAREWVCRNDL